MTATGSTSTSGVLRWPARPWSRTDAAPGRYHGRHRNGLRAALRWGTAFYAARHRRS